MSACGSEISNPYDYTNTDFIYGYDGHDFFASNKCVSSDLNYGQEKTTAFVAEGAGAFNLDTKEVVYSQNIYDKLYPASTTKILTAYIIIRYCNTSDMVTVSNNAVNPGESSSVCGLKEGDVISVEELLYGLMLESGNDAAIALAEYYSGSVEAFAEVMNEEARKMGCTNSHFVNPSGFPNDDHYTTVYDMYLIFSNAVSLEKFVTIISTKEYQAVYTSASGKEVKNDFGNTCGYLTGAYTAPENVTVIGGKTGTTNAAGYCLCLYSQNERGERIISIVFKADGKSNLYLLMNEILVGFAN